MPKKRVVSKKQNKIITNELVLVEQTIKEETEEEKAHYDELYGDLDINAGDEHND